MRATFFRPSPLDGIRASTTPWFPVAGNFSRLFFSSSSSSSSSFFYIRTTQTFHLSAPISVTVKKSNSLDDTSSSFSRGWHVSLSFSFLPSRNLSIRGVKKRKDTRRVLYRKERKKERSIVYPYYWIGVIISSPSVCNWILKWSKRILSALLSFFSRFNYQETSK